MVFAYALAVIGLFCLCSGLAIAFFRVAQLRHATRVVGHVVSEHVFRQYGTHLRYYRVSFPLATGQQAQIRSSWARAGRSPKIGAAVPVAVSEIGRMPKARIATWTELWFSTIFLIVLGGVALGLAAYTQA
jgi:hypothetical protein